MIEFKYDPRVQKYFEDATYSAMVKTIGFDLTKAVKKRVNQLKASPNFQAFLQYGVGKPEHLTGTGGKDYSIHVSANFRLIIEPDTEELSPESLSNCTVVIIKGVVDYHGGKTNWILP